MVDDDFEAMLREAAEEMQADDPSAAAPSAADLFGSSSGSSASAAATSATEPAAVDAAAALDADAAALKAARSAESPAAETSGGNDGHVDEADSDQDSDASSAAGGDLSRGRANRASEWDLEELAAVRRGREKVPFKHRVVKEVKSSLRRFYTAGRITSKACALASNSLKPHVAKLSPLPPSSVAQIDHGSQSASHLFSAAGGLQVSGQETHQEDPRQGRRAEK